MNDKHTYQTKQEILKSAYEARVQEVMHYQINIDNYKLAINHIKSMSQQEQDELKGFYDQLNSLYKTELLEQKKAKIMLSVISLQIKE